MWRISNCNPLAWGPYCPTRREAVWLWIKYVLMDLSPWHIETACVGACKGIREDLPRLTRVWRFSYQGRLGPWETSRERALWAYLCK